MSRSECVMASRQKSVAHDDHNDDEGLFVSLHHYIMYFEFKSELVN